MIVFAQIGMQTTQPPAQRQRQLIAVHLRPALRRFRFPRRDFFRAPDSFRRQLERPRQDQRDWKTENHCGDKHLHHPKRRFEGWKQNGGSLN